MHNTPVGVSSFTCEVQRAILIACKLSTHLDEFMHTSWALAAHNLNGTAHQTRSSRGTTVDKLTQCWQGVQLDFETPYVLHEWAHAG